MDAQARDGKRLKGRESRGTLVGVGWKTSSSTQESMNHQAPKRVLDGRQETKIATTKALSNRPTPHGNNNPHYC